MRLGEKILYIHCISAYESFENFSSKEICLTFKVRRSQIYLLKETLYVFINQETFSLMVVQDDLFVQGKVLVHKAHIPPELHRMCAQVL